MENTSVLRISKSNALINASYRLTLTEMQIILYGIGLINPLQPEFPRSYRIDIDRFAKQFNRRHGQIYKEIKDAVVKRFWERDFSYIDDKGKIVTLRWLTKMVHQDKTGYIEIKFSEEIQPYLRDLQTNFTAYYIDKIVSFKSIYSVRLYEYAVMFLNKNEINQGKFGLLINEIKTQLDITEKYKLFSNFKLKVLNPAKKEINQFSDLTFDYKIKKLGRTPHEIEFMVSRKIQIDDKITPQKAKVSTETLTKAKNLVMAAGTGWDLYAIENQFYAYTNKAGQPKNIETAFLGFVKKKILQQA
jgi:plasmid replication initiation protein